MAGSEHHGEPRTVQRPQDRVGSGPRRRVGSWSRPEQIPHEAVEGLAFLGELGLDGSLRRVAGMVPMVGVLGELDVVVPGRGPTEARVAALGQVELDHAPCRTPRRADRTGPLARSRATWTRRGAGVCGVRRPRRRPRSTRWPVRPSKSRPPAVATPSSSDHPVRARPCWRPDFPACSLGWTGHGRSKRRWSTRRQAPVLPPGGLIQRPFRAPHHTTSASASSAAARRAAPRRDHPRPSRRPLPRRARRVPPWVLTGFVSPSRTVEIVLGAHLHVGSPPTSCWSPR